MYTQYTSCDDDPEYETVDDTCTSAVDEHEITSAGQVVSNQESVSQHQIEYCDSGAENVRNRMVCC